MLCMIMAFVALPLAGTGGAFAVVAGGLLIALSYIALANVTRVLMLEGQGSADVRRARAVRGAILRFVGRYALLGLLAYVMIARLRLHPIGLLAGASSFAAAAFVEAVRLLTKKST